ncbi:MAG: putative rRNA maturation factor [Candidatus Magasanikbacteria bacterium GW2011_GWA2_40_10]|uniref:Endoribonuclease YbeY n=1 Tax=Candidatus Magasanikbacteria bacterium GW2011_GWA2_40_10 TaxID=1619037 RepID=A0A0G0TA30_9BACT|nr:MAG: putative rRNA maturation factor [Candidatus Magasanikbacteria bacterium GW2011_GWA2_40_10]
MLKINFNKRVKCSWTSGRIKKVFNIISSRIKISGELEINIVGEKEIKDLNFRYRKKNKVTDVLSFAWQEDSVVKTKNLGQIYICYPQIERQAKEFKVLVEEEFVRMLTHGFLHIIGYNHEKNKDAKKMFKIQEEVVGEVFKN